MKPLHVAMAVLVAAVWGVNFVVIDVGLGQFPPLLFSALRFLLAALPAVFFVGSPRTEWRWVIAIGVLLGVCKFGLLFIGMHAGMPAGLSSLLLQSQAPFTLIFAAVLLRERPTPMKLAGMGIAVLGVAVIAADYVSSSPVLAFVLVLGAALFWGLSNVATRKAAPPDMFRFMVWVSVVPPVPLILLSLPFEGVSADLAALRDVNLSGFGATAYVAWGATLFGFGVWGFLIRTYDASTVAPYSLLVPVFGMSSAALLVGERLTLVHVLAAVLIVVGVGLTARRGRTSAAEPAAASTSTTVGGEATPA